MESVLNPAVPPESGKLKKPHLPWRERCRLGCRVGLTVLLVLVAIAVIPVALITRSVPNLREIRDTGYATKTTRLYDASDKVVLSVDKEERTPVPLSAVSPHVVKAVLAVEDQRFYQHLGIDVRRMVAALITDIKERRFAEGASTITQQLARQMFLDDRKTLLRKAREIVVALRIERQFEKDKILELYLNEVYFGHGYYGIEAASRGYFGKSASALNLSEASMLAAVIKAPSRYSPRTHLDRATARRATVLARMVAAGYIDKATADANAKAAVKLTQVAPENPFARYFKSYVVRELVERLGEEAVFEGGLHVYTTLDPELQRAAELVLNEGLQKIEARRGYKHPKRSREWHGHSADSASPYLQGALVAMTPAGHVAALVGGRDFNDSSFDRATQGKRQPGSAFKPFIYAAALESGLTPSTVLTGLASVVDDTGIAVKPVAWWPNEAHGSTTNQMTVRNALRTSSNRAAALVLSEVGLPRALSYVNRFGFEAPAVPSMVLGTGEVSVLKLTAAYAAFANSGRVPRPITIRRVEDRWGAVILEDLPSDTQAISAVTAFQTAEILADVINAGSGYAVRSAGFTLPAGGKTGTTDDFKDAWFAGFTPQLVATVWVGFDDPKTIVREGFGGDLAAPIWGRFMKLAAKTNSGGWIAPPNGVIQAKICKLSGLLASPACGSVQEYDRNGQLQTRSYVTAEYFRSGTAPFEFCNIHGVAEPLATDPYLGRVLMDRMPSSPLPGHGVQPPASVGAVTDPPVLDLPVPERPVPAPLGGKPADPNEVIKQLPKTEPAPAPGGAQP